MSFCTVINCIDGRIQLPVIKYLQNRFKVTNVDNITEAGVNRVISEQKDEILIQSILRKVNISIEKHHSIGLAISGHYDCAGNPASKDEQIIHIQNAVRILKQHYNGLEIIGLWVDKDWEVHEVAT